MCVSVAGPGTHSLVAMRQQSNKAPCSALAAIMDNSLLRYVVALNAISCPKSIMAMELPAPYPIRTSWLAASRDMCCVSMLVVNSSCHSALSYLANWYLYVRSSANALFCYMYHFISFVTRELDAMFQAQWMASKPSWIQRAMSLNMPGKVSDTANDWTECYFTRARPGTEEMIRQKSSMLRSETTWNL